jgi:hypothetical protein
VLAVGFERGQFALLPMQTSLQRGPYALELGIGKPGQGDEFGSAFPAESEGRENTFDVRG